MRTATKDKVFRVINSLSKDEILLTTKEIAEQLGISRQNTSHYLTQLVADGVLLRIKGRPVKWQINAHVDSSSRLAKDFSKVIGADGSLKELIERCVAGINYPPNGLDVLLQGPSGVGKSFLARQLFEYAKKRGIVDKDAPFVVLNCADYANNPELLSAALFGYTRGAYTGADHSQKGVLAEADGGILFLDEVHRLSNENQEKLFLFMDTGKFRPLGENDKWSHAAVRFIFATSESTSNYLLETFERRIPIVVQLPKYSVRPVSERISLIEHLFSEEAVKIHRDILITAESVNLLISGHYAGNVGKLKNIVMLLCAEALSQTSSETLQINGRSTALQLDEVAEDTDQVILDDLYIPKTGIKFAGTSLSGIEVQVRKFVDNIAGKEPSEYGLLVQKFLSTLSEIAPDGESGSERLLSRHYEENWKSIVVRRYGLVHTDSLMKMSSCLITLDGITVPDVSNTIQHLPAEYDESLYIANKFAMSLPDIISPIRSLITLIVAIILRENVGSALPIKGLILAHGESTASSIQSVVNQLCEGFVFEAIDMPINSPSTSLIEQTRVFIRKYVHEANLVILVDMGSLSQMYPQIKNDLVGELLLINNVTTAIALDIGIKMNSHQPFNEIASDADKNYSVSVQYYEGFSPKENLIISCMSGLGISDQLKQIFSQFIPSEKLEIFTRSYQSLRKLIKAENKEYFKNTRLVITTSELPNDFTIPSLNIYGILDTEGSERLEKMLHGVIGKDQFQKLMQKLVRFFSLSGVADRLTFLNPKIAIVEVELVVNRYENFYQKKLSGIVKLNLYMHIALMMERLVLSHAGDAEEADSNFASLHSEFYATSRSVFRPMEIKYNIHVNQYELSLIYEILQQGFNGQL